MRRIRRSLSYSDAFETLLEQGLPAFGIRVIEQKRQRVDAFVADLLVPFARTGT